MFSQNQVQHLLIGKSSTSLTASAVKPAGMNTGEIGAFTKGGTKYLDASDDTGEAFVLYKKMADGSLLKSDVLSTANVKKVTVKIGTAATEKVEYYGYNGSTGSFEVLDENFYRIRIEMKEGYTANDHGTTYFKHAIYESDASATQYEIASGLANSGYSNFSKEVKNSSGLAPITFKAICSNAGVANAITAGAEWTHLTFVAGSKYVTGTISGATSGCLGTDEQIDTIVAGDFLRAGTAVTADTYKIVSITNGTATTPLIIEIDKPYRGATTNIAAASTEYITAALGAAADWGVVLTGQELPFTVGKLGYKKVDWVSGLEGSTSTTYTSSTSANPGTGVYEQVAEMEWFLQGNEGNNLRVGYPYIDNPRSEVEDAQYDFVEIEYVDTNNGLVGANSNRKVLTLAIPQSTPAFYTSGADDLAGIISVLLTGVPVYNASKNGSAMAAADLDL